MTENEVASSMLDCATKQGDEDKVETPALVRDVEVDPSTFHLENQLDHLETLLAQAETQVAKSTQSSGVGDLAAAAAAAATTTTTISSPATPTPTHADSGVSGSHLDANVSTAANILGITTTSDILDLLGFADGISTKKQTTPQGNELDEKKEDHPGGESKANANSPTVQRVAYVDTFEEELANILSDPPREDLSLTLDPLLALLQVEPVTLPEPSPVSIFDSDAAPDSIVSRDITTMLSELIPETIAQPSQEEPSVAVNNSSKEETARTQVQLPEQSQPETSEALKESESASAKEEPTVNDTKPTHEDPLEVVNESTKEKPTEIETPVPELPQEVPPGTVVNETSGDDPVQPEETEVDPLVVIQEVPSETTDKKTSEDETAPIEAQPPELLQENLPVVNEETTLNELQLPDNNEKNEAQTAVEEGCPKAVEAQTAVEEACSKAVECDLREELKIDAPCVQDEEQDAEVSDESTTAKKNCGGREAEEEAEVSDESTTVKEDIGERPDAMSCCSKESLEAFGVEVAYPAFEEPMPETEQDHPAFEESTPETELDHPAFEESTPETEQDDEANSTNPGAVAKEEKDASSQRDVTLTADKEMVFLIEAKGSGSIATEMFEVHLKQEIKAFAAVENEPNEPVRLPEILSEQEIAQVVSDSFLFQSGRLVAELKNEVSKLKNDNDRALANNKTLSEANVTAGASYESLIKEVQMLQMQLEDSQNAVKEVKAALTEANTTAAELRDELTKKKAAYAAEVKSRIAYQKALQEVADLVQSECKDSPLAEKALALLDKTDSEAMAVPAMKATDSSSVAESCSSGIDDAQATNSDDAQATNKSVNGQDKWGYMSYVKACVWST